MIKTGFQRDKSLWQGMGQSPIINPSEIPIYYEIVKILSAAGRARLHDLKLSGSAMMPECFIPFVKLSRFQARSCVSLDAWGEPLPLPAASVHTWSGLAESLCSVSRMRLRFAAPSAYSRQSFRKLYGCVQLLQDCNQIFMFECWCENNGFMIFLSKNTTN